MEPADITSEQIQSALADITAETDPTLKHLKIPAEDCARKLIVSCPRSRNWSEQWRMNSENQIPAIPKGRPISWEDWLKGRRARRETGNKVAPPGYGRVRALLVFE
jgi:hypothetical protein